MIHHKNDQENKDLAEVCYKTWHAGEGLRGHWKKTKELKTW